MQRDALVDGHGRRIGDVRVSVTDRCNFRCQYCMPAEGLPWLDRDAVLTFEELTRLVGLLASMGVANVRLTGGEPLVRRDLPRLVGMLREVQGVEDLALTTNGYLLERDAAALVDAGVHRFNVSIDSLQQDRFYAMTRRDALPQVLRGLDALRAAGAGRIKVNAVALRGFTEQEVLPFAAFARERPFEVRFIEFMPLDADRAWKPEDVLTGAELRAIVEAEHGPLVEEEREPHATARVFRFADGAGRLGFVEPVSNPFCADCDRLRLTAEGALRTCLFSLRETDLRGPLRAGATDAELERLIRDAVWRKELKHRVNDPGFVQPERSMSAIGG
ncbi:GTP 3',8-cyclase MoaA [Conexibacter sp. SYSU D00693]|uniref:GTP 3',8-cyclase MoaA n=1 Tax=Conexibacter sp. SYSU D00693 TaxID=2812560 RepID=UPI00196A56D8|nr:GTP 3',8-cyclase MoaA [Conexibacter sp. SYSU D00693]